MADFKVKKGLSKFNKTPIEEWSTDHLCAYFKKKFLETYGIETRRPMGQIKLHINKKFVSILFRMEGRSIDVHPNELFRNYMDWIIERKNVNNFRIWYFSKQDMMADYLDARAKKMVNKELGSEEDFKKQEEQYLEEAQEHFNKRKKETAEKYKDEDEF